MLLVDAVVRTDGGLTGWAVVALENRLQGVRFGGDALIKHTTLSRPAVCFRDSLRTRPSISVNVTSDCGRFVLYLLFYSGFCFFLVSSVVGFLRAE